jgi:hypothetical protein
VRQKPPNISASHWESVFEGNEKPKQTIPRREEAMAVGFPNRVKVKQALNARLKADDVWNRYNDARAHLKQIGIDESIAWRAAAFPFPPADGSPPEIACDPAFDEIAAGWANGTYSLPEQVTEEASAFRGEEAKVGLDTWRDEFRRLADIVGTRAADELAETRWVIANYLIDVRKIEPDGVPSAAALSILSWVQSSPSNFGDFLRTNHARLLPDKRQLEYEQRFRDDGRQDLDLLREFEEELAKDRSEDERLFEEWKRARRDTGAEPGGPTQPQSEEAKDAN